MQHWIIAALVVAGAALLYLAITEKLSTGTVTATTTNTSNLNMQNDVANLSALDFSTQQTIMQELNIPVNTNPTSTTG